MKRALLTLVLVLVLAASGQGVTTACALGTSWPFYGSELMSGLPFRVWDMDYVPLHRYDTIASGTMFKITKLQTEYSLTTTP